MNPKDKVPGLTVIDGLDSANFQDGETPRIEKLTAATGSTVIRISFTAGQEMKDHRSPFPILVHGAVGEVEFTVADHTVSLVPGTAVHVEGGVTHRLFAKQDSVVTLVVLR
ncbi:cupin [Rhodococcus sp. IEGM 1379]|uniref:cupin n=1 Tax=Rhodococcus sp. IEGM 1379 TaxID=3047086 RepID=UPI0024B830CC|nr:cupin [Rhodococcus sp. IEGM 1379]MDI9916116.1 cupin [Rhodococcus sp. IEGM 1379]